ncbi:MAG: bifunctional ADP-heptose synthase [Bacteroidia bacterium]|nr:bifunctional ADP-heptose synthase [Bacteroidia bacterium]
MVTHTDIDTFLAGCRNRRILVVGDLMLDRYLWGKVERISPEAPVPVVDVYREENRLGGAANVALNLHALGAIPVLCGVIGQDHDGDQLLSQAEKKGFKTQGISRLSDRRTTVKVRILGNNQQQVLRVDREDKTPLPEEKTENLLAAVLKEIRTFDAVVIQDYDKGFLNPRLAQTLIVAAGKYNIPVLVDPKFRNFFSYPQSFLFKPNLKELSEGIGIRLEKNDLNGITDAVLRLREKMPHAYTLVTLSENGMLLIDPQGKANHIPARIRDITDVSGAGDTVISVVALAVVAGFSPLQAAQIANLAGGLVCEEVGVVPIRPERLRAGFP